ncbi:gag-pol polyprotein [Tanacetum coccineum]
MKCPQHYFTKMQEVILFYNGLDVQTRQILDSRGRSTETYDGLAAIQAQLNNLGRKIKKVNEKVYAAQVGWELCKRPHYTKDCPLKEEGKTLKEAYYTISELAHTKLTVELADMTVKYPKGIAENILVRIGKFTFIVDFIILDMPEDIKVPLILGRSFLSTARAKIDVYKIKITLRVGEEKIIFKSVKSASSLIKGVYMLSLRERIEVDLEARLMGETLVLNRSLDPFLEDYI